MDGKRITLVSCCVELLMILLLPVCSQAAEPKVLPPILSLLLKQCDSSHLDLCATSDTCTGAGGYWWSNNTCSSTPKPQQSGTCADRGLPGPETVNYGGHEWQRCDDSQGYNWDQANAYCANLTLDGHSDWRLPNKVELKSLVVCTNGTSTPLADYSGCGESNTYDSPTIDEQFSCQSIFYWSSSVYVEDYAWFVVFDVGYADWTSRTNGGYARCVR